jgi:hypothetical protein
MDKKTEIMIQDLIKSISEIDNLSINNNDDNDDDVKYNNYLFNPEDELRGAALINSISVLADEVFITNEGHVNHENIQYLYKNNKNYSVFPVEVDRFGWLIGGIETEKGVITFG